jgi:hypothetical protein
MEGGEVLPVCRQQGLDDEDIVLAVTAAAVAATGWWQRRRKSWAAKKRRYRTLYKYVLSSFSLELMPLGRARVWLRFSLEQIRQLVGLLELDSMAFRRCCKADSELALCLVAAWLSFPGRWHQLSDLFGKFPTWLSTVFNNTVLFLVACFGLLLQ